MPGANDLDLGAVYRDARQRLTDLVRARAADAGTPVPACPGWSVRDVVAHLVAIAEDVVAGELAGIPSDDETALQVARRRDDPVESILEAWARAGPGFEALLSSQPVWPAAVDVLSHEQDVRGALADPGARDDPGIVTGARLLVSGLRVPARLTVRLGDEMIEPKPLDPEADGSAGDEAPLHLTTTHFEAFRFRMGRRSRRQLLAMDWRGDPAPIVDHLARFGPSAEDIDE